MFFYIFIKTYFSFVQFHSFEIARQNLKKSCSTDESGEK